MANGNPHCIFYKRRKEVEKKKLGIMEQQTKGNKEKEQEKENEEQRKGK